MSDKADKADKLVSVFFEENEDIEYYDAQQLLEIPFLFYVYDNVDQLVKDEQIPKDKYLIARFSKSKNQWTKPINEKQICTYLVEKKWTLGNILNLKKATDLDFVNDISIFDSDDESEDESNAKSELKKTKKIITYPPAPPRIILSKKKSMINSEGEKINVIIIGDEEVDSCYFKLSSVADSFGIVNLRRKLNYANTIYKKNSHYVRFMCTKESKIISGNEGQVQIFLTYLGMYCAIHDRKLIRDTNISINLNKWLSLFYGNGINEKYKFDFTVAKIKKKSGYVYCIRSDRFLMVKIGYTRGTEKNLRARYATSYGKDLEIDLFWTEYPSRLEKKNTQGI